MTRFETKLVGSLILVTIIPLVASVLLVGQMIKVSDSVAERQIQRMRGPIEKAASAYRDLFATKKMVFRLQGQIMAQDELLRSALAVRDQNKVQNRLQKLMQQTPEVGQLDLFDSKGVLFVSTKRNFNFSPTIYRPLTLNLPVAQNEFSLHAIFFTPLSPFEDFRWLGQVQGTEEQITKLRNQLNTYYRVAFLIIFGGVLLVASVLGLFIARRTARRVAALAAGTRKVAMGDLDTQVQVSSNDELGDLANSFNEMVSQIKESRERIAYLEKIGAWQEIARRLAHEIKNPLTPIQLAIQQLHQKYPGTDPDFTRMLGDAKEIITEEVDGLRRLVQDFSAFAKLPSVRPEPVEIQSLLDDFFKSYVDIQEKAIISWQALPSPCSVLVDRMLIKHVLYNLIENAIQAAEDVGMGEKIRIAISTRVESARHRLVLNISDNGPGIEAKVIQQVFDPYFTTKEKGTGLGLAIVKKIILEHGGTISVQSQKGKETQFMLTLPLAKKEK